VKRITKALTSNLITRLITAVVLPFVMIVPLFLLSKALAFFSGWIELGVGLLSLAVSATIGFRILATPLARSRAILLGLVYFPVVMGLLIYFQLVLAGLFFGDSL